MAHHDDHAGLPITWPFRAGGTLIAAALGWFCLAYALEDFGYELHGFWEIFWAGIAVSLALIVLGAAFNIAREWRRQSF